MPKKIFKFITILIISATASFGQTTTGFQNFITAKDGKLFDGPEEFRFVSYNIPNLLTVEDNMPFTEKNAWRLPNAFEIDDALKTIQLVRGKVARTYVITVKRKSDGPEIIKYVEGPGKFNERAFRTLDSVLVAANKYQVRLLIPFVDNWKWMGGKPQYSAFRGKDENEFWTDPQIKADFKQTISFILNRVNTISGIAYKDDEAILAWELGNELRGVPMEWIAEMAAYVKSIDKNHLINDGIQSSNIPDDVIDIKDIDILSTHHYEDHPDEMLAHIQNSLDKTKGKKPYYIGEFGFISTTGIQRVLELVQENEAVSGAMIWSLRFHNRDGGFYWHSEPMGGGLYKAYHWPGFNSGNAYDEKNVIDLLRKYAYSIDDKEMPLPQKPDTPELLPIMDVAHISWQGAAGAAEYIVERSFGKDGPWEVVGKNICDAAVAYQPLFNDLNAEIGNSYIYRVRALNFNGQSDPSNAVGPVDVKFKTLVDNMKNIAVLYQYSGKVNIETHSTRKFKEDLHRLKGEKGSTVTYFVPLPMSKITIQVFSMDNKADLELSVSESSEKYQALEPEVTSYFTGELDYGYAYPFQYQLNIAEKKYQYLKIEFRDECQLGRIEVRYGD